MGRNPATVNGEVEAYLYEYFFGGDPENSGNDTVSGQVYAKAMNDMYLGFGNFSTNYSIALNNFKTGAIANKNMIYNSHEISKTYNQLIKTFIDLFLYP